MIERPARSRIVFVSKFAGAIVVLYMVVAINPVNDHVIVPFTGLVARASGAVLHVFDGEVEVDGTVIRSPRFALDVQNGCNGVEATILLVAAIFAFPATLKSRVLGLLAATLAVQLLNVVRLTSLFWLGAHHHRVFDLFHVAVWQSLIILAAISMFILWSWKFAEKTMAPAR